MKGYIQRVGDPPNTTSIWVTISLGRALPCVSSNLPGTFGLRFPGRPGGEQPPAQLGFAPAWSCSRWGLPGRGITTNAGGLLHRLFTIAIKDGSLFLWPDPVGYPISRPPHPGCYPAPCSLECGLSSILHKAKSRSPDPPEGNLMITVSPPCVNSQYFLNNLPKEDTIWYNSIH